MDLRVTYVMPTHLRAVVHVADVPFRSAVAERTPRDPHELIVQVLMFVAHGIKGGTECSGPGSGAMYADRFGSSSSRGAVYAIASVSSPSL